MPSQLHERPASEQASGPETLDCNERFVQSTTAREAAATTAGTIAVAEALPHDPCADPNEDRPTQEAVVDQMGIN
ncbi:MAG TPA: hypothetical protein VK712_01435 [Verrucomicrobiae bacterium]|jgi:hypothetical protein|nr:hypothetical protein [Verrucomicrobiae bacterium]